MKNFIRQLTPAGLFLMIFAVVLSCNKKKFFDGPEFFSDDFESYSQFDELTSNDDSLWSFTQITQDQNNITIDTGNVHSGNQSLKFVAVKSSTGNVSKCSIAKQNMAFWEGEVVRVSAWYYIEGNENSDWLFLFDLEEQAMIGAGPGMRLALVDNQLRLEHKFNERDIVQDTSNSVDFPRNQWVEVVWEMKLSQKDEGYAKLWQDGQLVIDTKDNRTLPSDILYSLQGTKGMVSSIEIGITACSHDNDVTLWVDDILFERVD